MLDVFRRQAEYAAWADSVIFSAASGATDAQLDTPLLLGPGAGSLRSVLVHTQTADYVWLKRCQGHTETKWSPGPAERGPFTHDLASIALRARETARVRRAWLEGLAAEKLWEVIAYRDSKGSVFRATLADMLTQTLVHGVHHRAQAANACRRLELALADLDFMYWARLPIAGG